MGEPHTRVEIENDMEPVVGTHICSIYGVMIHPFTYSLGKWIH
jgi:hypothetical protein